MGLEIAKLEGIHHVCTKKNEKGEICSGHLKEWMTAPNVVVNQAPAGCKLYRCRRCRAAYSAPPQQHLHAGKSGQVIPPQNLEVLTMKG